LSSRLSTRPPRNMIRWTTQPRIHGSLIFSLWPLMQRRTRVRRPFHLASGR